MRCGEPDATYTRPVSDQRSTTPLARKLGIVPGSRLRLHHAPANWTISSLPDDVRVLRRASSPCDVVVAFFTNLAQLEREVTALTTSITTKGSLWVAWPRRAGGHTSDVSDNSVRALVLPLGLVDVKVAALDDDWSALKMVWRLEHRRTVDD